MFIRAIHVIRVSQLSTLTSPLSQSVFIRVSKLSTLESTANNC